MRSFIHALNQCADLAKAHGFATAYSELTAWQRELEQRSKMDEMHIFLSKAASRHLQQSLTRNMNDATFARMIRNIRNALRINEQLIDLVESNPRSAVDNDEKRAIVKRYFTEVNPIITRCRFDDTSTLNLEQLLEFNRKTIEVLKNPLNVADANMPAPFVLEAASKPTKPTKTAASATRNQGHGFFKKLTGWMKDLADPSRKVEDTMMSFMNMIVKTVIQAIGSLFKPFLGPDSEPLVKEFSKHASEAFDRFTGAYNEESTPSYVPSFDLQRARQEEREAAAASAPAPLRRARSMPDLSSR